jgi:DNA-binding NtrC family response regulator
VEHEGCRVLVVDDEDLVISVIREVLQLRELQISEASDGESAVELLWRERFDLVIADKNLPGINGLEVLRRAKDRDPTVATLLVTGYSSRESAEEAMVIGIDDYIVKPFDVEDLADKVEEVLDLRLFRTQVTPHAGPHPLGRRVLICDPDGHSRPILLDGVQMMGHTVELVDSLSELLDQVSTAPLDGLICDLEVLNRDAGRSKVLRSLLLLLPGVKFITVAPGKDLSSAIASLQRGACKVLFRPLESAESVADSLREYFGEAARRPPRPDKVKVLVARDIIDPGTVINRNLVDVLEMPPENKPDGAVTAGEINRISGRKLEVSRLKGDLILWNCFRP